MNNLFRKYILKSRFSLMLSVIISFILLVVVEGLVMDRESRVYTFENPYFDLNLNNLEDLDSRRRFRN